MITTEDLLEARFAPLDAVLREEIISLGKVVEVGPNVELIRAGQQIMSTMLVLDGRIKVYREDEDGNEFLMYYLEPGSACAFSIMCALNNEKSQITAMTETDTTIVSIPFDATARWMSQYPSWDVFVLKNYRNRFEELLNTLDHIAFRSMDERLLFYLKGKIEGGGSEIHISHQEIARDLNSAREVISRLLKKLEQRGVVQLERNLIRVVNTAVLDEV
jgi:CRP/FNR family transcriptional regulator